MNEFWGRIHFWASFIFMNLIFQPMFAQGMAGMLRRMAGDAGTRSRCNHCNVCVAEMDVGGVRCGALTGDYNGIHLSDWYARRFGFYDNLMPALSMAGSASWKSSFSDCSSGTASAALKRKFRFHIAACSSQR
mgnify:CR=1 FL=1